MVTNSLLFFLLWQLPSLASVPSSYRPATHFYRNTQSPYPSGQASRDFLGENQIGSQFEFSYRGQWDRREFLLKGESILRDIQLAEFLSTTRSTRLFARRDPGSLTLSIIPSKKKLKLISIIDSWALVYSPETYLMGYITLSDLKPNWDDLGFFTNFIETSIRKDPSPSSVSIKKLPRLTRIKPLKIISGWIQFKLNNEIVFADSGDFLSRIDFAQQVFIEKIGWTHIKRKTFGEIITTNNQIFPLLSIKGLIGDPSLGIVIDHLRDGFPSLRSHFKIQKIESRRWAISQLPKHGQVVWIQNDFSKSMEKTNESIKTLTTEELIHRGITSVSFSSPDSSRFEALASAHGIYKSFDGEKWQKVQDFGNINHPVSILPNGVWFVGPYKSQNQGETFEPFIKWDLLARYIKTSSKEPINPIKIKKIEPVLNSQVQFHLEIGSSKKLIIRSPTNYPEFKMVHINEAKL